MGEPEHEHRTTTPAAAISREIIGLLKRELGRGPTKAKTHLLDDCVVVLMREAHTHREQTERLAMGGRSVAQGRVDISEHFRQPLIALIERETGKKVAGFMSSSQQEPSLLSFVFVFDGELADSV